MSVFCLYFQMEFLDNLYDKVEGVLPMEGALAPVFRAAIGAGLGWLLIEAIRPSFAYNPDGSKRPWNVLPEMYESRGTPTAAPWVVGPLAGAVLLAGFV